MKCPENMNENENRKLKLHDIKYIIVNGNLWFERNIESVLLKCVTQDRAKELL